VAGCFLTSILLIYRNCSTALLTINDAASPSPFLFGGLPTTAEHVDDDTTILPWCLDPLTKATVKLTRLTDSLLENGDTSAHMVPWNWISIPRRPLTTSGKMERNSGSSSHVL
jgi:hypothetical protein